MARKKWSLSEVEATIAIVIIAVTAGVNFVTLRHKVDSLSCDFIESQIIIKKKSKLDYSSGIRANSITQSTNQDVLDYWRNVEEQIIILSTEIKALEEKRTKEC